MKKTTFVFLAISLISLKLFAQAEKTTQVRVGLLNGPTCVPAAYLMENKNTISSDGSEAELTFEKFADPQALLPKMIKKEIDVGFMPANVAAKVYNSGNKSIICCAVVGLGNLALIRKRPRRDCIANRKANVWNRACFSQCCFRYSEVNSPKGILICSPCYYLFAPLSL